MARLDDLKRLGFAEQMRLLMEAHALLDPQDIPALLALAADPLDDAAVDAMARGVLRALLLAHPAHLARALEHEHPQVRRAAVHAASSLNLAAPGAQEALHSLVALARQAPDHVAGTTPEDRDELLLEALTALAQLNLDMLRQAGALPVFRTYMDHPDSLISGVCLSMLGALQDCESLPALTALLDRFARTGACCSELMCEAPLWNAMDALTDLATVQCPGALEVLARHMRHPNATARRQVHDALAAQGERALPLLLEALRQESDPDMTIMAVNLLGRIGHKRGVDAILDCLEHGRLASPNQRFSAYEALGRIPSLSGKMYLLGAWETEADPAGCIALAQALEQQYVPAMAQRIVAPVLNATPERRARLLCALASVSTPAMLEALYAEPVLREQLVEHVLAEGTPEALAQHRACLEAMGETVAAARLAARQEALPAAGTRLRLLAIDDSAAMRSFYLGAGAGLGMEVAVAEHGQDGLGLLNAGEQIHCVVVDMNMPVMDGITFVRHLRSRPAHRHLPVIMATTESTVEQREQAAQAGVDEFLRKPFTMHALQSTIARLLHT
ncbi:MAG: response regulator [Desulfovibrio sp.]|nr:response regulator [Desulfovibrio sp.]